MSSCETVYLLLGSNLGDRMGYLERAVEEISRSAGVTITGVSSVYLSPALEMAGPAPDFLNQAVSLACAPPPAALLHELEAIERRLGRRDKGNYRPRTIDIDILLYGSRVIRTARLVVPHPRLVTRAFALAPLLELAPHIVDPVTRRPLAEYLNGAAGHEVRLYQRRVAHAV